MATIEQALPTWLLGQSGVSALIGSRMYPEVLPQAESDLADLPAVVFRFISSTEPHTIRDRSGLVQSRMRFECYGGTYSSALAVARAIKNSGVAALKGLTEGVDIRGVTVEDGILTDAQAPNDGSGQWRYLAEFDLMVSYIES